MNQFRNTENKTAILITLLAGLLPALPLHAIIPAVSSRPDENDAIYPPFWLPDWWDTDEGRP